MTYVATGLTNGGLTTNFSVTYDNTLSKADGLDRGNALLAVVESDYQTLAGFFQNISLPYPGRVPLQIAAGSYAGAGWQTPPNLSTITLTPGNGQPLDLVRYLIASELTEQFMMKKANGWGYSFTDGNEGSKGEGLSRFLGFEFLLTKGLSTAVLSSGGQTFFVSNNWLNSPRADFINYDPDDKKPDATTGCTTLFIYYLFTQLNFSISEIINAGAETMAGVYTNLTKDLGNPFPFFSRLIGASFPGTNQITAGPNLDNPFPIGLLSFYVDNSTFGKDNVQDLINSKGGVATSAFWLVLEGFSINAFNSFGIKVPFPTGTFLGLQDISIQATPGVPSPQFEDPTNLLGPQRIRFSFDVVFKSTKAFPGPGAPSVTGELDAVASISGSTLSGTQTSTGFELLSGEDPFFSNFDPNNPKQEPYLSQDLRVFTVGVYQAIAGGPAFTYDSYSSIQNFLQYLNNSPSFTNPSSVDPLNVLTDQTGYETGDSSVYAIDSSGHSAFNFAIARVRLQGSPLAKAENVRVFFRLFVAQSCDTDYQPSTTYLSTLGTSGADLGNPVFPLASNTGLTDPSGQTLRTVPFFATNATGSNDYNNTVANGNIRTIEIPDNTDKVWAYYGCFLDVFNSDYSVKFGALITALWLKLLMTALQSPALTATGSVPTTSNWNKLAQRNIQITTAEDPTSPATHVVPQAFDLRPSRPILSNLNSLAGFPDEIMIDWGDTPVGSTASIYWPQLNSADVLTLANQIYSTHLLTIEDPNTLQCTVTNGVTYIPIPAVVGVINYAGLFTVALPDTITDGQYFRILVRRITTRRVVITSPPEPPKTGTGPAIKHTVSETKLLSHHQSSVATVSSKEDVLSEPDTDTSPIPPKNPPTQPSDDQIIYSRQVVGAFQISIPVTNKAAMLWPEENTLAVLTWRLQHMSPINRWYPILQRYISLVSARVSGLGGNPASIPPTLKGIPIRGGGEDTAEDTAMEASIAMITEGDLDAVIDAIADLTVVVKTEVKIDIDVDMNVRISANMDEKKSVSMSRAEKIRTGANLKTETTTRSTSTKVNVKIVKIRSSTNMAATADKSVPMAQIGMSTDTMILTTKGITVGVPSTKDLVVAHAVQTRTIYLKTKNAILAKWKI